MTTARDQIAGMMAAPNSGDLFTPPPHPIERLRQLHRRAQRQSEKQAEGVPISTRIAEAGEAASDPRAEAERIYGSLNVENRTRRMASQRALAGREMSAQDDAKVLQDLGKHEQTNRATEEALGELALTAASGVAGPVGGLAVKAATAYPKVAAGAAGFYGLTKGAPSATSTDSADIRELRSQLENAGSPELARLNKALEAARARSGQLDKEASTAKPGSQARSASQGRAANADEISKLEAALATERGKVGTGAAERAEGVMSARAEGQDAKRRELEKTPKPFLQRWEDMRRELPLVPEFNYVPYYAGAAGVAASKALSIPSAIAGRTKAMAYLKQGQDAVAAGGKGATTAARDSFNSAKILADEHAPAKGVFSAVMSPKDLATGGAAGGSFGLMPLSADAMTQQKQNPEKRAQQLLVDRMLPIDPKRQREQEITDGMPDTNPSWERVNDPMAWAKSGGAAIVEGAMAGKLAGLAVDATKPGFRNVRAEVQRFEDRTGRPVPATERAHAASAQPSWLGSLFQPAPTPPPAGPLSKASGRYPAAGSPERDHIRETYRENVLRSGAPIPPRAASDVISQDAAAQGGRLPSMTKRIGETNRNVEAFEIQNNRLPITPAEWNSHVWRDKGTLGIVGAGAGAAGAGLASSGVDGTMVLDPKDEIAWTMSQEPKKRQR